jgi:hypothetical protein
MAPYGRRPAGFASRHSLTCSEVIGLLHPIKNPDAVSRAGANRQFQFSESTDLPTRVKFYLQHRPQESAMKLNFNSLRDIAPVGGFVRVSNVMDRDALALN